jgi:hypothetical protein
MPTSTTTVAARISIFRKKEGCRSAVAMASGNTASCTYRVVHDPTSKLDLAQLWVSRVSFTVSCVRLAWKYHRSSCGCFGPSVGIRGTQDDARRDIHERRCENRPFEAARSEAENEHDDGQHEEINHCILRQVGTTPNYTVETCSWSFDSPRLGPRQAEPLSAASGDAEERACASSGHLCQRGLPLLG